MVAEQVTSDLAANEVAFKRVLFEDSTILMSDYEKDYIDIKNLSKTLSAESLGGAYRAESTDQ